MSNLRQLLPIFCNKNLFSSPSFFFFTHFFRDQQYWSSLWKWLARATASAFCRTFRIRFSRTVWRRSWSFFPFIFADTAQMFTGRSAKFFLGSANKVDVTQLAWTTRGLFSRNVRRVQLLWALLQASAAALWLFVQYREFSWLWRKLCSHQIPLKSAKLWHAEERFSPVHCCRITGEIHFQRYTDFIGKFQTSRACTPTSVCRQSSGVCLRTTHSTRGRRWAWRCVWSL